MNGNEDLSIDVCGNDDQKTSPSKGEDSTIMESSSLLVDRNPPNGVNTTSNSNGGRYYKKQRKPQRADGSTVSKGNTCNLCWFEATDKSHMEDHMKHVHAENVHQCTKCDQAFSTKRGLTTHKNTHTKPKHQCSECEKKFNSESLLNRHLYSVHDGSTFKCDICELQFDKACDHLLHKRTEHNKDQKVQCDKCNKFYKDDVSLRSHIKRVHSGLFTCDQCGKVLQSLVSFKLHQRITHEGIKYPCDECGKQFRFPHELKRHKKVHHSEDPLDESQICDKCGQKLRDKIALSQHKRKVHDFRKHYSCPHCDYAGKDRAFLKAHITLKHEGKKLKCNKCSFEATSLNLLYDHKSSHKVDGDPKPTVCSTCGFVAATKRQLRHHQERLHENRFTCSQCFHVAQNVTALRIHMMNKHEGVTFDCDQCNFRGTHPKYLKRHKEVHHDLKRHHCDQCDYSAKDKQMVTLHKQTKHECIQFACDECELQFANQPSLKKHKKTKHSGDKKSR